MKVKYFLVLGLILGACGEDDSQNLEINPNDPVDVGITNPPEVSVSASVSPSISSSPSTSTSPSPSPTPVCKKVKKKVVCHVAD